MEFVGKKYKMVSSENFDEFMKTLGVGLITRKAANAVTPTVELRKDGDNFVLVTSSTFKTTEVKFVPGQEFDEERADGAKVKSVCTFEGNKLKQVQKGNDGLEVTYVREFGPEEMKAVMTAKDVTCTRVYKVQ
ncbi:sodium/calcium exchanger regulatory protein 1 [Galleria mellonella]|uniref:Fatty acid-binding protein, muscle n=1 Tax=Galleria mellonella TaxID=7137 RepID=A0A3G1T1H0_GALME|nr:sodium/calcium exchanger regulatory protein 1 [Galleria mellonella]AXY94830.1 fatty acid binding protein 1 [Galleria mellonella]